MRKNIVISDEPKTGKSTLVEQIIAEYPYTVGFITKEIRKDGLRTGFELFSSLGESALLADINTPTIHQVGKYFVQKDSLELFLARLPKYNKNHLLYMDEIGQMELISENFKKLASEYLDSQNTCVVTLTSVFDDDFVSTVKNRADSIHVSLTSENRGASLDFVKTLLKKIVKARRYVQETERFTFEDSTHVNLEAEHGVRRLALSNGAWQCDCEFFSSNSICSHVIAVEALPNRSVFRA